MNVGTLGPPLQSAWAVQDMPLANLYTSVVINALVSSSMPCLLFGPGAHYF